MHIILINLEIPFSVSLVINYPVPEEASCSVEPSVEDALSLNSSSLSLSIPLFSGEYQRGRAVTSVPLPPP